MHHEAIFVQLRVV